MSVKKKILILIFSSVTLLILVFTLIVFIYMKNMLYKSIDSELRITAITLLKNKNYENLKEINKKYWIKIASNNEVIFENEISKKISIPIYNTKTKYNYEIIIPKKIIFLGQDKKNEVDFRVFVFKNPDGITVQIAKPIEDVEENISTLSEILTFLFILSLIILYLISNWLSNKIFKPFKKIIENVDKVNADNLSSKIPLPDSKDEFYKLTSSLNEMLDRLNRQFTLQKEFISNISHEFKTPITIMLLTLEELIQDTKTDSETKEKISQMYQTLQKLSFLTKNLLMLLSIESGFKFNPQKFNLSETVKEVSNLYEIRFKTENIKLEKEFDGNILFYGDKELINRMLMNLIDNAIKYNKEKGIVKINLYNDDRNIYFKIFNTGRGILKENIDNIFHRFYRQDKVRSNPEDGFGLGLSIVKEIVIVHKGKIDIKSDGKTFTEFVITLPLNLKQDLQ